MKNQTVLVGVHLPASPGADNPRETTQPVCLFLGHRDGPHVESRRRVSRQTGERDQADARFRRRVRHREQLVNEHVRLVCHWGLHWRRRRQEEKETVRQNGTARENSKGELTPRVYHTEAKENRQCEPDFARVSGRRSNKTHPARSVVVMGASFIQARNPCTLARVWTRVIDGAIMLTNGSIAF